MFIVTITEYNGKEKSACSMYFNSDSEAFLFASQATFCRNVDATIVMPSGQTIMYKRHIDE